MPKIALIQLSADARPSVNKEKTESAIREAAANGAQIVCTQELFTTEYFCRTEECDLFNLAEPVPGELTEANRKLAAELGVVIVASGFEKRATGLYHNTAWVVDADGSFLGMYRKMHIPQDPGFEEKFYFTPGDLGYKAFDTKFGRIGVLICWDQWYPEAARLTAMQGAEIIFYPTAIGWLPEEKPLLEPIRFRYSTEKIVDDPEEEKPEAAESPEPKAPRSRNRRRKPRPQAQDAAPEQAKPAPQEAAAKPEASGDRPRRRPNHRRRKPRPAGDGQ